MLRALAILTIIVAAALHAAEPEPFVVHEWGVWIRSQARVADSPEAFHSTISPPVRSLLGPPAELADDLPDFVLHHDKTYTPRQEARFWKKPVIHLYGSENLKVTVQVGTPLGKPVAYWPKPAFSERVVWNFGAGVSEVTALTWSGKLRAAAGEKIPLFVKDGHWWKTLRDVSAKYIETENGTERFLFYEAMAVQEQPLKSTVSSTALTLRNSGTDDSGPIVVLIHDGKSRHFIAVKNVAAGESFFVDKTAMLAADDADEALLQTCREQWEKFGMSREESRAIVETWKPDLLQKTGFLVISQMPRELYDQMFPIAITPEPSKLVRVGLVFDTLPGEPERLGWLPALRAKMAPWVKDLSDDDFDVRANAIQRFAVSGDIAAPLMQELAKYDDASLRETAAKITAKWGLPSVVLRKPDVIKPEAKPPQARPANPQPGDF